MNSCRGKKFLIFDIKNSKKKINSFIIYAIYTDANLYSIYHYESLNKNSLASAQKLFIYLVKDVQLLSVYLPN